MIAPLKLRGLAAWATGMPDWATLRAVARGEAQPLADAPKKPAPAMLPPNERRRAPDSVLLALQCAQAACEAAGAEAAALPSIFASTHGDLAITDAMCRTLAENPAQISPTRFHNSVHNAAAGYWTIGVGCHAASTALSAYRASFAQALLEAAMQLDAGAPQVLMVAYDSAASGPLAAISSSEGLLGVALVLDRQARPATTLGLSLRPGVAHAGYGRLEQHAGHNAMAPALALLDALANARAGCEFPAGQELVLQVELVHA